jgi:membrane protease YdiL (CAAX protease family)
MRPRPRDTAFAFASAAVLAAYNNVIGAQPWHRRWYAPVNACAAGAALAAAAASGLTAADIGLGRDTWRPGRLGSLLPAATTAGWLVAAAVPATRPFLNDKRITTLDRRGLAYQVAFRIPVGTVLWEEIAFRGVLQAALRRVMSERAAIAVTSGVFGIWHVRPTAAALRVNGLAGSRRQAAAGVAAGVAVTTAGGVLFSWLRARSGSLAAPVLMHLATNCVGPVVAWAVAHEGNAKPPPPF